MRRADVFACVKHADGRCGSIIDSSPRCDKRINGPVQWLRCLILMAVIIAEDSSRWCPVSRAFNALMTGPSLELLGHLRDTILAGVRPDVSGRAEKLTCFARIGKIVDLVGLSFELRRSCGGGNN